MLQATNINAYQAEDIEKLDDNTVLISINNEYESLFPLKLDRNSSKVCTVQFADITDIVYRGGTPFHPIGDDDAKKIVEFIDLNKNKNIICHCAMGKSRSAAVCLYTHILYGHKLKDNFFKVSFPNSYVVGKLFVIYEKYVKK